MNVVIVCAPQTFGCNTGMYSVDLAAWYFFQKYFPGASLQFAVLYPHKCDFGDNPIETCTLLDNPDIYDRADRVVFWGDFLHAFEYRNSMIQQLLIKKLAETESEAKRLVRKFLYLSDANKELLGKVVIYGETMLFNDSTCVADSGYIDDLKRLFKNCRRVWMREPFSALAVKQYVGDYTRSFLGTDCAQLLGHDFPETAEAKKPRQDLKPQKTLGVFFGRSKMPGDSLVKILKLIKLKLNIDLAWIDWGIKPFFLDKTQEFFPHIPELEQSRLTGDNPLEILGKLQNVDFVISDTYHVCVNAWNLGIPAICVIDNSHEKLGVNSGSELGRRDKRIAFYWSYNASPYLLFSSDLSEEENISARAQELSGLLTNIANTDFIISLMSEHAKSSQASLVKAIQ